MLKKQDPTNSIPGAVESMLRRALMFSAIGVALFVGIYSAIQLKWQMERTRQFIFTQTTSQAQAAYMVPNILAIERELNRFVESWEKSEPFEVAVAVKIGSRLIAQSGHVTGPEFLKSQSLVTETLSDGNPIQVTISLGLLPYLSRTLLILIGIESFLGLIFFWINRKLKSMVQRLASPLTDTLNWIEDLASRLPESIYDPKALMTESDLQEVSRLTKSIELFIGQLAEANLKLTQAKIDQLKVNLAEEVAHDLRSPLSTLDILVTDTPEINVVQRRKIGDALERIRSVARALLLSDKDSSGSPSDRRLDKILDALKPSEGDILLLVRQIITEKKIQHGNRLTLSLDGKTNLPDRLPAQVEKSSFLRVLSNLIDNAIEASSADQAIQVELKSNETTLQVHIVDHGKGIATDILPRVTERGFTFDKVDGSGIGLFYAKDCVNRWGGDLKIESQLGQGTRVQLEIPLLPVTKSETALELEPDLLVVSVDDDPLIHQLMQFLFTPVLSEHPGVEIIHLSSPEELRSWHAMNPKIARPVLYLMDFEFTGEPVNGLDLIEELDIGHQSVLVSGCADQEDVAARADALQIRRINKDQIGQLPIIVRPHPKKIDGVAIGHRNIAMLEPARRKRVVHAEV